jgi:hypothetical protein
VDLNYAYSPYCAFNDAWACPLPPAENWLSGPVRAGARAFPGPRRTAASGHADVA